MRRYTIFIHFCSLSRNCPRPVDTRENQRTWNQAPRGCHKNRTFNHASPTKRRKLVTLVLFQGNTWELSRLKPRLTETEELPVSPPPSETRPSIGIGWTSSGRRRRLRWTGSVRFDLLEISKDQLCNFSDEPELLKREPNTLWRSKLCLLGRER